MGGGVEGPRGNIIFVPVPRGKEYLEFGDLNPSDVGLTDASKTVLPEDGKILPITQ